MSQNSCCAPGCAVVRSDGVPLHLFPNPETSAEKFRTWIFNVGGEIAILDHHTIYRNRRVCHRHFDEIHKYPTGRLSKLAIPTLHIPGNTSGKEVIGPIISTSALASTNIEAIASTTSLASTNIEAIASTTSLASTNIEATTSKPTLASTSNVLGTHSNDLISGHQNVQPDQTQRRERKIKKTTKSKSPRVTLAQYKEFKTVLKKLRKCESDKKCSKAKYMIAKKMSKTTAFNMVCKNMSYSSKLFCQMQVSQSGKKKKGRRFTLDEKNLALSLYKYIMYGRATKRTPESGVLEKESSDTADLLMFFDDLFDSVNGSFSAIRGGKIYRTAVTPTSPHHKLWNYSLPVLKTMKFSNTNNQGVVPSLSSWIKTIEGLKLIVKYLKSKGINSLLLRNFNQDALENFFGAIRAHGYSNIMPTSSAFEGAFKTLLINNISSSHSVGANCEKDDGVCLQSLKHFLENPVDSHTTDCGDEIDSDHLNVQLPNTDDLIQGQTPMLVERSAAIGYCSGWIAQLAKKHIYKNCVACRKDIEAEESLSFHKYIKMKDFGNKKWLCYPTRALFDFFAHVEHVIIEILKEHSNKKNISEYIKFIINVNVSFISCQNHKDDLRNYLIDKSTRFFIHNWCKDVNNVLTGKITFWDVNDPMKEKANRHYLTHKGRKRRTQNYVVNV